MKRGCTGGGGVEEQTGKGGTHPSSETGDKEGKKKSNTLLRRDEYSSEWLSRTEKKYPRETRE